MILAALTHSGTHAFPAPITVDFTALPPLDAISGANGAGKTTLLDLIAGALYLTFPYRPGALHRHFITKGVIDLTWSVNGRHYRSRVMVDPENERTEATLTEYVKDNLSAKWPDSEMEFTLAGPLVREYKQKVEAIVGPLEMFLASAYSVQTGVGAFLRLPRADRKALLIDLLGLGVFPRYEASAKQRAADLEREADFLRRTLADLEARVARRPGLETQRADLTVKHETASLALTSAQDAVTRASAALATLREARAALVPLRDELATLDREIKAATERQTDAAARRTRNLGVLTRADEIRAAVTSAVTLRERLAALTTELDAARRLYQVRQQAAQDARHAVTVAQTALQTVRRDRERLERAGGLVKDVPCHGEGLYAGCPLIKDARAAADALPSTTAEEAAAVQRLETARSVTVDVTDPCTALVGERDQAQRALDALAEALSLAGPLDAAQARVEELDGVLAEAAATLDVKQRRVSEVRETLATLPGLEAQEATVLDAQRAAQDAVRQTQQDVAAAERDLGGIAGQLAAVEEAEQALRDTAARVGPLDEDLADWSLLVKAFGASGIPALLIDRALPEISTLASDLLRTCFGEEVFTITLTTQKESADGSKLLETLDVIVRRGGEPIDAALLSGGESVLVSEALSLALALYNAGRSGRRIQTLLRDEVSAPLDVDRAPAYVRMLRRAATLGGFRHVLFVSHQPAAIELADAVLHVKDGSVRIG